MRRPKVVEKVCPNCGAGSDKVKFNMGPPGNEGYYEKNPEELERLRRSGDFFGKGKGVNRCTECGWTGDHLAQKKVKS